MSNGYPLWREGPEAERWVHAVQVSDASAGSLCGLSDCLALLAVD